MGDAKEEEATMRAKEEEEAKVAKDVEEFDVRGKIEMTNYNTERYVPIRGDGKCMISTTYGVPSTDTYQNTRNGGNWETRMWVSRVIVSVSLCLDFVYEV